jgi:molybdopterin-guanine dinucleotide biosynthesis protein B
MPLLKNPIAKTSMASKPILSFCASSSGIGKTTLLTKLIPLLAARGLQVSVIKHTHHNFAIDLPGKDSYVLREAGAVQMLLGSRQRWALTTELTRIAGRDAQADTSLSELLAQLDQNLVDLILVEGFRNEAIPKIEIYRPSMSQLLLAESDSSIIAIASDGQVAIEVETRLPILDLNNPPAIVEFILNWLNRQ